MLEPHTMLFVVPTGVAKTGLALDLLEHTYFNHFDFHFSLSHPAIQQDIQPTKAGLDRF